MADPVKDPATEPFFLKPEVGMELHYFPGMRQPNDEPHAARIVSVLNDRLVNVVHWDKFGGQAASTSVQLLHDPKEMVRQAEPGAPPNDYARWFPWAIDKKRWEDERRRREELTEAQPVRSTGKPPGAP
jgi:hypothetical protein